jgi:hypothetical protein
MMRSNDGPVKCEIDAVEITTDKISGRAGLGLVSQYLTKCGIIRVLSKRFSFLKKHEKGTSLLSLFHQVLCFFFDGTAYHLTRFDQLKNDPGYAGVIETKQSDMISSHSVKRFFKSFSIVRVWLFRKVLKQLFLWRLSIEKPEMIKIGIDTMVMDNNDAEQREGCEPTYKKVKGFQPLHLFWGRYMIDAIFRNGKAHSNYGNHVQRAVTDLVRLIRGRYRKDVPIVLLADAGFFDESLFLLCQRINVGFIVGGRLYDDIKQFIDAMPDETFREYKKGRSAWFYCQFGNRRKSWQRFWRTIYAKPVSDDDGQVLLEYAKPESIIYTNIGMRNEITRSILALHGNSATEISPQAIITSYHFRARDELVNRAFKDFGTEHLPFKSFRSNAAYYYLMSIAFFLFESFKVDMDSPTIPVTWYAGTFRRRCLDIAGKIIHTGGKIILKVPKLINTALRFIELWEKCCSIAEIRVAPV